MTFPILVTQTNDTFTASVLGSPQVSAEGETREQAVATVTAQLQSRLTTGEVVLVNVEEPHALASADDPGGWRALCTEVYRARDNEKAALLREYDSAGGTEEDRP